MVNAINRMLTPCKCSAVFSNHHLLASPRRSQSCHFFFLPYSQFQVLFFFSFFVNQNLWLLNLVKIFGYFSVHPTTGSINSKIYLYLEFHPKPILLNFVNICLVVLAFAMNTFYLQFQHLICDSCHPPIANSALYSNQLVLNIPTSPLALIYIFHYLVTSAYT